MKDRMTREELWYCMRKSEVGKKYVRLLQDIYEDNDGREVCGSSDRLV